MLLLFLIAHQQTRCGGWFLLSLMCTPQALLFSFRCTSECYVSCRECVHFCPSCVCRDLEGKKGICVFVRGGCDGRLRQNVCSLSPRDKWAPPPTTDVPRHPRCSQTSCGHRRWQAQETRSHSVINHHTLCMLCGRRWHPTEPRSHCRITSLFYKEKYWRSKKWICTGDGEVGADEARQLCKYLPKETKIEATLHLIQVQFECTNSAGFLLPDITSIFKLPPG